ncbi:unnamed protein product [Phyllotreta striolata]|uniref:J domain-containing protein n=1 Tax=Phyllotreta striolata TaxID=444603 RepID=A0A9N9TGV9_PHYSR|nr:unnamed protein product [Phyllotreta striolata]
MERYSRILYQLHRVSLQKYQTFTSGLISSAKFSTKNSSNICWKCGKDKTSIAMFCEKCHSIQAPVHTNNYFKMFEIEEGYSIDTNLLKDKFRKYQNLIHPDKFSNKTHEEQTISAEYSSLINKAYSSLMSPMKRAEHLLQLKGEMIEESQTVDEPNFLMNIMSMNEEVDNAQEDVVKLKELNEKNRNELNKLTKEIDQHFKNGDLKAAKASIIKLKYFTSISNRINSIFREAGVAD